MSDSAMVAAAGPTLGLGDLSIGSIIMGTDIKFNPRARAEQHGEWHRELVRLANSSGLANFMARKGRLPTLEEVGLAIGSNTLSEREIRDKFLAVVRAYQAHNTRLFQIVMKSIDLSGMHGRNVRQEVRKLTLRDRRRSWGWVWTSTMAGGVR